MTVLAQAFESIQDLVDETPFISCKYMYKKRRIPNPTCLCVLRKDLGFRKYDLRWIPHLMTENEA
jgi:hypothetical protein